MDLLDKVALVTGGSMGIGAAIALELARRGASVAIVARHGGWPALIVQRQMQDLQRRCAIITADLRHADDCRRAVQTTVEHLGRLDVLIHNAGGPSPGRLTTWAGTMARHHRSARECELLSVSGGLAVSASAEGRSDCHSFIDGGNPRCAGAIAYATAKGAFPSSQSLARDLADDNIRVNCVAPGVIRTRFHDDMSPERKQFNLDHRIPLHREGTAQQVAESSPCSSRMTISPARHS